MVSDQTVINRLHECGLRACRLLRVFFFFNERKSRCKALMGARFFKLVHLDFTRIVEDCTCGDAERISGGLQIAKLYGYGVGRNQHWGKN